MRQTGDQIRHLVLFDEFTIASEKVETDFGIITSSHLLSVKVALGERTEFECQLKEWVGESLCREVEQRTSDFVVVQMGKQLVRSEFRFVGVGLAFQPLIVVQFDEGDEGCGGKSWFSFELPPTTCLSYPLLFNCSASCFNQLGSAFSCTFPNSYIDKM